MSTREGQPALREIRLLRIPVALWSQSQEHFQDLLREFALVSSSPSQAHPLPNRLLELVARITADYSAFTTAQNVELLSAAQKGIEAIDFAFSVPEAAASAALSLGAILDEADEYCRQGQHLLTLATPTKCLLYRRWYLSQIVDQIGGKPPITWEEWSQSQGAVL